MALVRVCEGVIDIAKLWLDFIKMAIQKFNDSLLCVGKKISKSNKDEAEELFFSIFKSSSLSEEIKIKAIVQCAFHFESLKCFDEATFFYERAESLLPGHGEIFSRLSLLNIKRHWGARSATLLSNDRDNEGPAVSMMQLGVGGRFADQLCQYALLRMYARQTGALVEVPDWIGRYVFDLNDPTPSATRLKAEAPIDVWLDALAGNGVGPLNCDLRPETCWTIFETDRYWEIFREQKDFVKSLFKISDFLKSYADKALENIRSERRTLVAIHVRRGDFRAIPERMTPERFYIDLLKRIWPELENPILYIASDEAEAQRAVFKDFPCVLGADLAEPLPGAAYFLDWYVLTQADVVAVALSRFSWLAAQLNERATMVFAPGPDGVFAPFDPWDRLL